MPQHALSHHNHAIRFFYQSWYQEKYCQPSQEVAVKADRYSAMDFPRILPAGSSCSCCCWFMKRKLSFLWVRALKNTVRHRCGKKKYLIFSIISSGRFILQFLVCFYVLIFFCALMYFLAN